MIVKDETHIIESCLESMSQYIDYWVICDTGSTDGTQDMIKDFFEKKGIPGELHEVPWEGFGKSRTRALGLCDGKADYAWMIDADDYVEGDFQFPEPMNADGYSLKIQRGDFTWWRNQIFKTGISWGYEGVLHEYAACSGKKPEELNQARINGNYHIEARTMGNRNVGISAVEKYTKDADMLLDALTNPESPNYEPKNSRYQFYLAQSYFDSQQFEKAETAYLDRANLGGWEEEVYYSMFRMAIISTILDRPWQEQSERYLQAWAYRPIRAEPLHQLARLHRSRGEPRQAYLYAKHAAELKIPEQDILFISEDVYRWMCVDEIGATAFYCHDFEQGAAACRYILDKNLCPQEDRDRIEKNLDTYKRVLTDIQTHNLQQEQTKILKRKEEKKSKNKEKKKGKIEPKKGYKKRKKK
tara:strand:+ start:10 stop:1251 length:1242 start_codon:yes stop_codon:yes gene_type:complete